MPASAREDRRPVLSRIDLVARGSWVLIGLLAGVYWVHQVVRGEAYERQARTTACAACP